MGRPPEGSQALKEWLRTRLLPVMVPGEIDPTDSADAQVTQGAEADDREEVDDGTERESSRPRRRAAGGATG